ncbi:MAG: NADH-quinone oxidoreductase subunit J [Candidatus Eremiobacteraeota bacterium]|nr:NADH-quinone oxidoreductase subunit J [Candidatus Eremiobacteraeota bacterium]MBC5826841.1 NADH-quinone oxidoreductase subunit J [Candidatus Eremiobacteraeota bacterium]
MIVLYWICAVVLVLSAIGVVASRQPVHSVVGLIVNFAALAVLFLTLNAEFLAMIQIIIYAGAILVLFLFVIALLTVSSEPIERGRGKLEFQSGPSVAAGLVALALMAVGVRVAWSQSIKPPPPDFGSVSTFGVQLLTTHLFAFEVTAFVLLVAIVGVVLMAGRKELRF